MDCSVHAGTKNDLLHVSQFIDSNRYYAETLGITIVAGSTDVKAAPVEIFVFEMPDEGTPATWSQKLQDYTDLIVRTQRRRLARSEPIPYLSILHMVFPSVDSRKRFRSTRLNQVGYLHDTAEEDGICVMYVSPESSYAGSTVDAYFAAKLFNGAIQTVRSIWNQEHAKSMPVTTIASNKDGDRQGSTSARSAYLQKSHESVRAAALMAQLQTRLSTKLDPSKLEEYNVFQHAHSHPFVAEDVDRGTWFRFSIIFNDFYVATTHWVRPLTVPVSPNRKKEAGGDGLTQNSLQTLVANFSREAILAEMKTDSTINHYRVALIEKAVIARETADGEIPAGADEEARPVEFDRTEFMVWRLNQDGSPDGKQTLLRDAYASICSAYPDTPYGAMCAHRLVPTMMELIFRLVACDQDSLYKNPAKKTEFANITRVAYKQRKPPMGWFIYPRELVRGEMKVDRVSSAASVFNAFSIKRETPITVATMDHNRKRNDVVTKIGVFSRKREHHQGSDTASRYFFTPVEFNKQIPSTQLLLKTLDQLVIYAAQMCHYTKPAGPGKLSSGGVASINALFDKLSGSPTLGSNISPTQMKRKKKAVVIVMDVSLPAYADTGATYSLDLDVRLNKLRQESPGSFIEGSSSSLSGGYANYTKKLIDPSKFNKIDLGNVNLFGLFASGRQPNAYTWSVSHYAEIDRGPLITPSVYWYGQAEIMLSCLDADYGEMRRKERAWAGDSGSGESSEEDSGESSEEEETNASVIKSSKLTMRAKEFEITTLNYISSTQPEVVTRSGVFQSDFDVMPGDKDYLPEERFDVVVFDKLIHLMNVEDGPLQPMIKFQSVGRSRLQMPLIISSNRCSSDDGYSAIYTSVLNPVVPSYAHDSGVPKNHYWNFAAALGLLIGSACLYTVDKSRLTGVCASGHDFEIPRTLISLLESGSPSEFCRWPARWSVNQYDFDVTAPVNLPERRGGGGGGSTDALSLILPPELWLPKNLHFHGLVEKSMRKFRDGYFDDLTVSKAEFQLADLDRILVTMAKQMKAWAGFLGALRAWKMELSRFTSPAETETMATIPKDMPLRKLLSDYRLTNSKLIKSTSELVYRLSELMSAIDSEKYKRYKADAADPRLFKTFVLFENLAIFLVSSREQWSADPATPLVVIYAPEIVLMLESDDRIHRAFRKRSAESESINNNNNPPPKRLKIIGYPGASVKPEPVAVEDIQFELPMSFKVPPAPAPTGMRNTESITFDAPAANRDFTAK